MRRTPTGEIHLLLQPKYLSQASISDQPLAEAYARRVLVVAPQPFYEDRGTPIAVLQVLRALSELGYGVDVLTFPLGRPVTMPCVEVLRIGNPLRIRHVPIGFSLRKLALDALLVPALRRQLRTRRYLCIHAVEEAAFPAVLLGRAAGIPVIYDMQSSLPEQLAQHQVFRPRPVQALLRRCEGWLLRRADTVMSSTGLAQTVRLLAPRVPVEEWQFPTTLPSVSNDDVLALRRQLGIPAEARVVVYSGTFEEYQGLDALVESIPGVCREVPDVVFVLVGGDPAATARLKAAAQRRGLNGHLRVLPRQAREEMPRYLALAEVLVSSRSYGENLPLKVFDYLAARRPVVATDIPSHRAILHSGRALLVPPDADGLGGGIVRILREPEEAETLVATASAYAAHHLEWGRFVATVQQVYDRVCARAAVVS